MPEDLPRPPDWQDWMKACKPALDAMVKAGWVTVYDHDPLGLVVQWTDLGKQKIDAILEMFKELHDAGLEGKDFFHVWTIANIYTNWPIEPPQFG